MKGRAGRVKNDGVRAGQGNRRVEKCKRWREGDEAMRKGKMREGRKEGKWGGILDYRREKERRGRRKNKYGGKKRRRGQARGGRIHKKDRTG